MMLGLHIVNVKNNPAISVLYINLFYLPGSPFKVPIEDKVDPSKCRMYGPGLNPEGVRATLPATFTVDCTQAGKAPLEVCI